VHVIDNLTTLSTLCLKNAPSLKRHSSKLSGSNDIWQKYSKYARLLLQDVSFGHIAQRYSLTDRLQYHANSRPYCVQYGRLKRERNGKLTWMNPITEEKLKR